MAWALVALPLVLLVAGFPVFLLLLVTAVVVLTFFSNTPPLIIHQRMLSGVDQSVLLAVPFFIFAGDLTHSQYHFPEETAKVQTTDPSAFMVSTTMLPFLNVGEAKISSGLNVQ